MDEGLIPPDALTKGRDLVNGAVKLINGYMNYLKRAAKEPSIQEEPAEYFTTVNRKEGTSYKHLMNQNE